MIDRRVRVEGPVGAPVLVLANSLGTTATMWDAQMPVLRQRFRVVRYEHRGHGRSPAPAGPYTMADLGADLLGVMDEAGVERASITGLSLGGMAAMWVAAHHPERVERLALCCTAPALPPAQAWHDRAAQVRSEGTAGLLDGALGRWFTSGYLDTHPGVRAAVAAMLGEADPEGYAGCCEAIAGMNQWADLDRITAPTLVLAGADDPVTSPAVALEMQQAIGGAALVVIAAASHLAPVEAPHRVTEALVSHLSGTVAERGEAARRAVLGDAYVERSAASTSQFAATFTDYITRAVWAELWTRPGLDRRTRSAVTLALLGGLGRLDELALHVERAGTNGLSEDEVAEILLHVAAYAGVPAANSAFTVAARIFDAG
ncbi:MAG: 3-oxoadipate enol-lactonase [Actinomycetota bacterium]|nr:3-oxoadipate enol-lactonase [Actinomycetota bacterium]